jgi:hypothetical protein
MTHKINDIGVAMFTPWQCRSRTEEGQIGASALTSPMAQALPCFARMIRPRDRLAAALACVGL